MLPVYAKLVTMTKNGYETLKVVKKQYDMLLDIKNNMSKISKPAVEDESWYVAQLAAAVYNGPSYSSSVEDRVKESVNLAKMILTQSKETAKKD